MIIAETDKMSNFECSRIHYFRLQLIAIIPMKSSFYKAIAYMLLQLITLSAAQTLFSQADTIKPEKKMRDLKNSLKVNLTNPMIFGDQCYWFGYERTIGDHQSFEINIGRFSFPKLLDISTDSLQEIGK